MSTVSEHLQDMGVRFRTRPHAPAMSAMGEALALGISPDDVAKAVLLDAATGHVLAIVPASRRVDLDLVREALGGEHVHLASEDEVERDFPEYELGALPPLPSLLDVPVVIDPLALAHQTITFAAGRQRESVETAADEVFTTLWQAAVLVVLTVFLFLQNWRSTIVPVIAIPISLVGTFAIMQMIRNMKH